MEEVQANQVKVDEQKQHFDAGMIQPQKQQEKKVLCIQFHISQPFAGYGLQDGFIICNYNKEGRKIVEFRQKGFSVNKILFLESHSALLTATGSDDNSNTIMKIWNLNITNQETLVENSVELATKSTLKFDLLGIRYNQQIIGLVSLNKIYFLSLKKLFIIKIIQAIDNKRGLLSIARDAKPQIAVVPDSNIGTFRVLNLKDYSKSPFVKAHKTQITNIIITDNGARVATTSVKATTVRIFNAYTRERLQQIVLDQCKDQILNIRFSWLNDWMAVFTKDGKLRVFVTKLTEEENTCKNAQIGNPKQFFSFLSFLFKSLGRQLPFAFFNLDQEIKVNECNLKYEQNNWIVMSYGYLVSDSTRVVKLRYDPMNGGCCQNITEIQLE